MQVKIIEQNRQRCEELCELLPKATIINGDATDHDLLVEEGIDEADAFVALTGMDEENIILSLFAKSQNVDKIVTKVNEDRRARMVCLLYTSDAADEEDSVDLGGGRIIKKQKKKKKVRDLYVLRKAFKQKQATMMRRKTDD